MAKVTALVAFIDPTGTERAFGEEFDLSRESDQEKADFDRLLREEIVTTSSRAASEVAKETARAAVTPSQV